MPCRRPGGERFLLLERAVSLQSSPVGGGGGGGGSKEVDALVAKLGEVLQLSARPRPAKYSGRDRAAPYSSPQGLGFLAALHRHHPAPAHPRPSLLLLQPPPAPPPSGSPRVSKQLCGRGWLRSAARAGGKKRRPQHPLLRAGDGGQEEDDDPHRLLQQLILSGNLIKEAVRRLQLAATTVPAAETSTTDSPGSASSIQLPQQHQ
ncbi:GSK-3-binding protein-like [Tiliqua scincoides]|uniref:GSK-3-binding protein-like n=1 Tax=Tiliqua scincoides TaxID=71010 RepID=UPI003463172F